MSNKQLIRLLFIFAFCLYGTTVSQTNTFYPIVRDTFKANLQNQYYISSITILPETEIVTVNGKILFKSEYNVNYKQGYFELNQTNKLSVYDTIVFAYQTLITELKKEYKNRSLLILADSNNAVVSKIIRNEKKIPISESIFGKGIQKSGSLIRGFEVSSNRDFTLNSGLRLQLSGRLTDDIEIVAALSDENTPIQPEGNTERLNEMDKVFIQVKNKNVIGVFGDYELKFNSGEFSKINRKLQGLKGEFFFSNLQGAVAIASSRGKFNTNQFFGKDGNQGPYRLFGANGENDISVIAGSEKVFFDGIEMKRGENNDYIIEYSTAMITFTSKRLITSASRISVDFEYTDRKFQRNFLGLNLSSLLLENKLKLSFNYYREGDNQDNLIDYALSDEEKKILEQAGNNRSKAIVSGVSLAQPDSTGSINGNYAKIDTTIGGNLYAYYRFKPNDINAIYNLIFTYVGEGNGDYKREALGNYKFTSIGGGAYLPIRYLPMPELKQNANFILESNLINNTNLSIELAGSSFNPNRFSNIGNNSISGFAGNLFFEMKPERLSLFENNLGKLSFNFRERYLQGNYSPFDRINSVEFSRDYNYNSTFRADEELREFNLIYEPLEKLTLNAKYGMLKKGNDFKSDRFVVNAKRSGADVSYFEYNFDYVKTDNLFLSTLWNRQNAKTYCSFGGIRPGIELLYENKDERNNKNDSLYSSSFRYVEAGPYIELVNIKGIDIRAQASIREESFPIYGILQKQSDALLKSLKIGFRLIPEIISSFNLTLRTKNFTDVFKQRGFANNETFLIYSQNRFNFFNNAITGDLYYEAATEQAAKQQKVFVKVAVGAGSYKYIGDVNGNGIADESDFELTAYEGDFMVVTLPTDELYPVVDLKTSTKWNIEPSKIFGNETLFSKILKPLSAETFIRIEENSKETSLNDIYLLKLSKFLNDSSTIRGANFFQQDLFLFKNESSVSVRARFIQRRSLSQFAGGAEKGFFNERSFRIRFQMVEEISNQTDFVSQNDNYFVPSLNNRSRMINKNELNSDFSYRPENNIEAGFKIMAGKIEDRFPVKPTEIYVNSQLLRINFSFVGLGRLRFEFERAELIANTNNFIPFEVTNGNQIGKNYFWRLFFDYRLAANFSASVNYDGRWQGGGKVINTLRAEARAFF